MTRENTCPGLTGNQMDYLLGLVRMDIRKSRRSLAAFTPRPGQDPGEAVAVLAKFRDTLIFRERLYRDLGGDPDRITDHAGR